MDKPKGKPKDNFDLKIAGCCLLLCIPVLVTMLVIPFKSDRPQKIEMPDYTYLMPVIESYLSVSRAEVPDEVSDDLLMPLKVGNFRRDNISPLSTNNDNATNGHAVYSISDESRLTLWLWLSPKWNLDDGWYSNFVSFVCGDFVGTTATNKNWRLPYRYGRCDMWNSAIQEIKWVNQDWIIAISSDQDDNPDNLLNFLAAYLY